MKIPGGVSSDGYLRGNYTDIYYFCKPLTKAPCHYNESDASKGRATCRTTSAEKWLIMADSKPFFQ